MPVEVICPHTVVSTLPSTFPEEFMRHFGSAADIAAFWVDEDSANAPTLQQYPVIAVEDYQARAVPLVYTVIMWL